MERVITQIWKTLMMVISCLWRLSNTGKTVHHSVLASWKLFIALYFVAHIMSLVDLHGRTTRNQLMVPQGAKSQFHVNISHIYQRSNRTKIILLWTPFFSDHTWELVEGRTLFHTRQCAISDCYLTNDKALMSKSSAVLFHGPNIVDEEPPSLPRPPHQRWVYVVLESPLAVKDTTIYHTNKWNNMFNWTMSYRADSDILLPYGEIRNSSRPRPKRDLLTIAKSKTKFVAWMVSHCNTDSKRELYVEELSQYIPVHVYGSCGGRDCPRDYGGKDQACQEMISEKYLFYIAFENAHCSDYITEKLYKILPLDTVPIVRGSRQMYDRHIPKRWYINTDDYSSPRELAEYLLYLHDNPHKYIDYFEGKEHYDFAFHMGLSEVPSWCELCGKLHDERRSVNVYEDVTRWWSVDDCTYPTDIPLQIFSLVVNSAVFVAVVVIITASCFYCRCCPVYKRRQERLRKKAISTLHESRDLLYFAFND